MLSNPIRSSVRQASEHAHTRVFDGLNSDFLCVHNLKILLDPRAPIFRRLESAELLDAAQIAAIQTRWQQQGGNIARIVLQETKLDLDTLVFFSNTRWLSHLVRQKRIGEYLLEARLVSEREVNRTVLALQAHRQQLPLGVALAERGFIKQSTADFFARSLVQKSKVRSLVQLTDTDNHNGLALLRHVELKEAVSGYLLSIVPLSGRLERLPATQLRKDLFRVVNLYSPNIVLDMSLVSSLNLATLRSLISAANMCREWRGKLCLCGLNEQVHAFLSCQLRSLGLESFSSRKAAIEQFSLY